MNQAELIQKRFDLEFALLQSSRKLAQDEATQYTRMDRINTAIVQTEALRRLLPNLQKELT